MSKKDLNKKNVELNEKELENISGGFLDISGGRDLQNLSKEEFNDWIKELESKGILELVARYGQLDKVKITH